MQCQSWEGRSCTFVSTLVLGLLSKLMLSTSRRATGAVVRSSTFYDSDRSRLRTARTTLADRLFLTTDGGVRGKNGGWAWIVQREGATHIIHSDAGVRRGLSSARAELLAILNGLMWCEEANETNVVVVTDAQYVVKCVNDQHYVRWAMLGWTTSSGKKVANLDLWQPLLRIINTPGMSVTFVHVKGHAGHPANEYVDELVRSTLRDH